ncbi:sensor histidine kinase [Nonomuraea roseoviolacea subsp. roseoviolacea]|uniref:histidine kinase n=1 Tax=Nonomuraea roseoviolacea subsp. carminata TaxID=160689 RepID=A0ABT1K1I1_9ACTN|nr:sensor histidine kinase [Nonomuraea roseoviolacea]MCP2347849.1 signal transduction histidine kinase [Nonomuraea roseoviolacea subsp. carminata]
MWRGLGYLLGSLTTAVVALFALPVLVFPAMARAWASWHRHRADRLLLSPPSGPVRVGTWRVLGWLGAFIGTSLAFGIVVVVCAGNAVTTAVTVPLWWALPPGTRAGGFAAGVPLTGWGTALTLGTAQFAAFAALTYWLVPLLARLHARICVASLSPSAADRLARRVETLTETRADAMKAHGAELRRIERDLHDGTQARLVAIAMRLGVARESLGEDPQLVGRLLREAHENTEEAMAELRGVIRTIYPPILADRGLAGALTALGSRSAIDTALDIGDLGTIPAAVEAVAYFTIAEALTNAAKHSRATRATVRAARAGDRLSIEVTDDGIGGADATLGTGLAGIRHRVLALDGVLSVHSPAGGPTTITVSLPCES